MNFRALNRSGALAQLGERLLCKQDVIGSIPIGSTKTLAAQRELIREMAITSIL